MARKAEVAKMLDKLRQAAGLAMALVLAACACGDRPWTLIPPRAGPGVPITGGLLLSPASLPQGATASFPAFDGDAFSAVLPVRAQETLTPAQALQEIEPVLRAVGFQRSLAELRIPGEPVHLPPASLDPLLEEVCREAAVRQNGTFCGNRHIGDGHGEILYIQEPAFRKKAKGIRIADLRADVERPVLQYVFSQLVGGVAIDGAGVFAARRSGESLSTVHGTLFNDYVVVNQPRNDVKILEETALRTLGNRLEETGVVEPVWSEPVLVLLAYGSGQTGRGGEVPALRHAWRAVLESRDGRSWMVWIDAETAEVLKLAPQWDHAQGKRWRRDPGLAAPTEVASFEVDPASGGRSVLALAHVFKRVDLYGDGLVSDEDEVFLPAGSAASFDVQFHDESAALCRSGQDPAFRQVHAYSHLYSLWKTITSAGTIPAFPEKPIQIEVDVPDDGDGSKAIYDSSTLLFVDGDGFRDNKCPDKKGERLNGVQDATTLAHEMAHLSVKRLQERRPRNWCGSSDCQLPHACGRALFHDFADAIALSYASTPCFSGWTHKNMEGTNANLYCKRASEEGDLPRRIELPADRFPDHRTLGTGPYADGQIAAAALWTVRQGMRSKDPASGTVLFWTRLQRALWDYAFVQPTCPGIGCISCARDLYRYLQDLERKMVVQWAAEGLAPVAGGDTANKVLAGWAGAGAFDVPPPFVVVNDSGQP
jgi:hypothetical protein